MKIKRIDALDRYLSTQVRERKRGVSAFGRQTLDAIARRWPGLQAKMYCKRYLPARENTPCDILLLQSAAKVIPLRRKKALIEALINEGINLMEIPIEEQKNVFKKKSLVHPAWNAPLRYFYWAAYARYLALKYKPRILLNDRNDSLLSPFLRHELKENGGVFVQLAHATTTEKSRRLGMNDYDYYFLFGKSSYEALAKRRLMYGNSRVVLSGSHMVDERFNLPAASAKRKVALLLGVGPDKEKTSLATENYQLVSHWILAQTDYELRVKSHPRSNLPFWRKSASKCTRIKVLDADVHLSAALSEASLAINIASNAVIEAALAKRPVIFVGATPYSDIFDQEQYFGTRVTSEKELSERVSVIEKDYEYYVARADEFACYHLAHGVQGLEYCLTQIMNLLEGKSVMVDYYLEERL